MSKGGKDFGTMPPAAVHRRARLRDILIVANGNACEICKDTNPVRWVLDHDHETNKVRGALCNACNSYLRANKEDADKLLKLGLRAINAATYLKKQPTEYDYYNELDEVDE